MESENEPRPTTAATAATAATDATEATETTETTEASSVFSDATRAPSSIEPDPWDNDQDEGYAESTSTSYLTSIASEIRKGVVEGGRTYAAYGKHKPWLPVDDPELDRNDLQHSKFLLLMDDELHLCPITASPQRILDLGTGTGIWAIDMADRYPSAIVTGTDTAPIQATAVPPNCVFEVDDVEDDWLFGADSFDLIHARELIMAVRDWPRLVRQAFTALKPGAYLQLAGSYPQFASDDGTLPPGTAYAELGQIYFDMAERIGASGREPTRWKRYLEEAGYVDVVERVLKIPTNPWPRDQRYKMIGAFELSHFRDTISNVFARGYTQILGGDPTYFEVLLAKARQEVLNRDMHSWVPFYVVYGRKPETSRSSAPPKQQQKSPSNSP